MDIRILSINFRSLVRLSVLYLSFDSNKYVVAQTKIIDTNLKANVLNRIIRHVVLEKIFPMSKEERT